MKRVFLIGFMGSGKTTIGKLLAENLGFSFIDLDQYIENRMSKKISAIFTDSGEDAFREIEHKILMEVAAFENVIISTGGGTPCFYNNVEIMNEAGISIYLKISNEDLANRLQKAKTLRPLIKEKSDEELALFIIETLTKRDKYYTQASLTITSENETPNQTCTQIINALPKKPANT